MPVRCCPKAMKIGAWAPVVARSRPDNVRAMLLRVVAAQPLKAARRSKGYPRLHADQDNPRQCKSTSMDCPSELSLCRACRSASIHLYNQALTEWSSILKHCVRKVPAPVAVLAAAATN